MNAPPITCLFLDIGGVLLTDGWDHNARRRAARAFGLALARMEERHHLTFETYEEGRITLAEYLDLVVFDEKRPFTRAQFRRFMFAQSKPHLEMLALVSDLKRRHGLKVAIVSNEGRELNAYRSRRFQLDEFVDVFVSSSFVHCRKPDTRIFALALDLAHVPADRVLYIDDNAMFVGVAKGLGIRGLCHTGLKSKPVDHRRRPPPLRRGEAKPHQERCRPATSRRPLPRDQHDAFDFDFDPARKKLRARYLALHDLDFLDKGINPLFIGTPGTGKTFLARALAYKACLDTRRVVFVSAPRMLSELHGADLHGVLDRALCRFVRAELLVVDDFAVLAMDAAQAKLAFQVISERYDYRRATCITTNRPFKDWPKVFPDALNAQVIAERLTERAEHFVLEKGFRIARP